ncbi:fungal-specific transcription factor domain-containing protein [Paraphoma chrysanthemicola]|nr:fungal-specific transcription factor domain-containing protein [Paraphoma chrysanthemicola]
MVACVQCRQRKVRCRGGPSRCDACTRLGYQCSMDTSITSTSGQSPEHKTIRKRGIRACDACRSQKSRCSGDNPICLRCRQLNINCHYTITVRQYRTTKSASTPSEASIREAAVEEPPNEAGSNYNTPFIGNLLDVSPAATSSENVDIYLGVTKDIIRRHIDAYFEFIYPIPVFSFLHRAEFLGRFASGTVPPALLLAVCAASSRFLATTERSQDLAKSWIEKSERMLFQNMGKWQLESVQAIVILMICSTHNYRFGRSAMYLALAVRTALFLKLHKESDQISFIEQECRRRLIWTMFIFDRFHAGGVTEYILLPHTSIHLQLPCSDHNFHLDLPISTPHLHDDPSTSSDPPISNFLLRIYDIRNRILQYAKELLDTATSPERSLATFRSFEAELKSIQESLPVELHFSQRAFQLRVFSPERTTFIILHIYLHHCHCELYRLLNPGYREALPQTVINSTSPDLVSYAQSQCLHHAIAIGDIITSTRLLVETGPYCTEMSCFVVLYQASCAILYACHRDSPACTISPAIARGYFITFIETLSGLLEYFPRFAFFVQDIRNMLRSIEDPNAPLPAQKASTEVDFRARPVPSEENSEEENIGATRSHERGESGTASAQIPFAGNAAKPSGAQSLGSNTLVEDDFDLGPYLEMPEYGFGFMNDSDQGQLWDWADALGAGFGIGG